MVEAGGYLKRQKPDYAIYRNIANQCTFDTRQANAVFGVKLICYNYFQVAFLPKPGYLKAAVRKLC